MTLNEWIEFVTMGTVLVPLDSEVPTPSREAKPLTPAQRLNPLVQMDERLREKES